MAFEESTPFERNSPLPICSLISSAGSMLDSTVAFVLLDSRPDTVVKGSALSWSSNQDPRRRKSSPSSLGPGFELAHGTSSSSVLGSSMFLISVFEFSIEN